MHLVSAIGRSPLTLDGDQIKQLSELSTREMVNALELDMLKQPQVALEVRHDFSPGIYARSLFIPGGVMLTGKIHKFEHLCIMSAGVMAVLIDGQLQTVQGPFICKSPPGTKRIAYAYTDTIWTTIHHTDETDLDKIEAHFTVGSEAEYLEFVALAKKEEPACLSSP